MEKFANPFAVTKAVDFTDKEILDYWVSLSSENGDSSVDNFCQMIVPTERMNRIIRGGKGSGKTHILRYFSYKVQKLRSAQDVLAGIKKDGYLGVYLLCSGLNSHRFKNKGVSVDKWEELFKYYFELGLSQILLEYVADALKLSDSSQRHITLEVEKDTVRTITELFDKPLEKIHSFNEILDFIANEKREIDSAVNNCIFSCDIRRNILVTPGHLLNGIPEILSSIFSSDAKPFMFTYIVDEFENLEEWQQKFINTLYRDKSLACTYRIGTRLDGIKTMTTYSAGEENKEGAEFESITLDNELRIKKTYREFALNLVLKRLQMREYKFDNTEDVKRIFGESLSLRLSDREIANINKKNEEKLRPWLESLKFTLLKNIPVLGLESESDVNQIIRIITNEQDFCQEKYNCFVLYQKWAKGENLLAAANHVVGEHKVDQHFKSDMLAQIRRESKIKQVYCGIDTFIEMSCGLPRILLMLLKSIFDWSLYYDERPFEKVKESSISPDIQRDAVRDTVNWFFDYALSPTEDSKRIRIAIKRLGDIFRAIRYSDKPSECELAAFSISGTIGKDTERLLKASTANSLLIEVNGKRRSKNGQDIEPMYQIHPILAPIWDLSTTRRGSMKIEGKDIDMIFGIPEETEYIFNQFRHKIITKCTAPNFGKKITRKSSKKKNHEEKSMDCPLFTKR